MASRPTNTPKGYCTFYREDGRVKDADTLFSRFLSSEQDELIGMRWEDLCSIFAPSVDPFNATIAHPMVLCRKEDEERFIGMVERVDQKEICFSIAPVVDEGGREVPDLNLFYKLSQDILALGDPSSERIVRVNPAFERLLGFDEGTVRNMSFYEFVHPKDKELLTGNLRKLAEGYSIEGARMRGVTSEGESIWIEWSGFLDPRDGLLYAIGRKVEEEVRAEQELQEKGDWYYGLFQNSPVPTLLHDGNRLVDLNNEAMRLLRVEEKEELVGERVEDHYQLLHSKDLKRQIRQVIQDGKPFYAFESGLRCREGNMIDLEVDGAPLRCDGVDCAYLVVREVSEKKWSERELKRREAEYRTIVEGIPESIHMVVPMDQEGDRMKAEFVNEEFLRQIGLAREDVIGVDLYTFLEERGGEGLYDYYRKAFQEKRVVDYSAELNYGGVDQVYHARAIPILDDQGRCVRLIVMSREVTEEIRTRRELDRLALITRETDNSVIITDPDGLVEWVNKGFTDISGYSLEEMKGKKPGDLLQGPDTDLEEVAKMRRVLEEETSEVVELINYSKNGAPYWIRINLQPIFDQEGSLEGFFSIQTDMTERNLMEERLRRNEERFRSLVENINEGIMWLDGEYKIQFINDRLLEQTGFERHRLEGQNLIKIIQQLDPGNEERIKEIFERRREGKKGQNEFEIPSARGERVPFLVSGSPFFDKDGVFQGTIAIFTELTERKRLERRVLNAVIQTQESERKRFAEELHDGIGQILSAVKMQLYSLEGSPSEELEKDLPELRSMVERAIDETRSITHGLMPNELRDFGLVKAVEKLLDQVWKSSGIQPELEAPEEGFGFQENLQVACYRIVQELLNNVMKHSEAEHVRVRIEKEEERDELWITVEDDGKGFDPNKMKGGDGTTNIKRRADLFGGEIEQRSEPGKGTMALCRIPLP